MLPLFGLLWSATVAPAAGCPTLVDAAVNGAPGALTALLARCSSGDLVRATERATGTADLSAFTRVRRLGGGDVISWKARHRIHWDGTCVAQIGEAMPTPDRLPAPACLVDATVRDDYDPNELADNDDDRARFLAEHPSLHDAFAACTGGGSGQTCLQQLLPRAGGDPTASADVAAWIKLRDTTKQPAPPQPREMRCRAVLADAQSFVVRCEGTLAKSVCNSESTPIQSVVSPRCASDHSLVVPVSLGEKPVETCLNAARAALWSSRAALADTRRRALDACTGGMPGATSKAWRDVDVRPTVRGLVVTLLRRQRLLAGLPKFPVSCTKDHGRCVVDESPDAQPDQRLAHGCGFDVWALGAADAGPGNRDDWREFHGRPLLRLKAGGRPSAGPTLDDRELGAPWLAIGNTLRQGILLTAPPAPPTEKTPPTFGDLATLLCTRRSGEPALCEAYIGGSQPADLPRAIAEGRWRRVRRAVQKDWPDAFRRFEDHQQALERGLALDRSRGETRRQSCQPLLVDACTGDVAEICAVTPDEREPPCAGERLPDGRCEVYRFARLPLFGGGAGAGN